MKKIIPALSAAVLSGFLVGASAQFRFGPVDPELRPLAGDWDGRAKYDAEGAAAGKAVDAVMNSTPDSSIAFPDFFLCVDRENLNDARELCDELAMCYGFSHGTLRPATRNRNDATLLSEALKMDFQPSCDDGMKPSPYVCVGEPRLTPLSTSYFSFAEPDSATDINCGEVAIDDGAIDASATNVNNDSLGQVLIYPYYLDGVESSTTTTDDSNAEEEYRAKVKISLKHEN